MKPPSDGFITRWFALLTLLTLVLLGLGGWVRLTDSGLSIVRWDLFMGTIPPLSDQAWLETFALYQNYPQYKQSTITWMTLGDFKFIFWMEYLHRLLARTVGLVSLVPVVVYGVQGLLTRSQWKAFGGVVGLFCLNGLFGWLMVSTGLNDQPRVSHYMLALHLVTALIVLGCCLWQFLRHWQPHHPEWPDRRGRTQMRPWAIALGVAVLVQMGVGGLMAGLDAGHVSYTFPKMNGYWLLPGLLSGQGILADMGSHLPLVHFEHRVLGMLIGVFAVFLYLSWAYRVNCDRTRWAVNLVGVICAVQVALGISVLFTHMDIRMALAHQMNGSLLWLAALYLLYCTCSEPSAEPSAEGGPDRVG